MGLASAILGEGLGYLSTGHQLNDPVGIALAFGALTRGFLYFDWLVFFQPLLHAVALGTAAWLGLYLWSGARKGGMSPPGAVGTAKTAALIGALPVLLQEVRSLSVMIWYGLAIWLSMVAAGYVARLFAARTISARGRPSDGAI